MADDAFAQNGGYSAADVDFVAERFARAIGAGYFDVMEVFRLALAKERGKFAERITAECNHSTLIFSKCRVAWGEEADTEMLDVYTQVIGALYGDAPATITSPTKIILPLMLVRTGKIAHAAIAAFDWDPETRRLHATLLEQHALIDGSVSDFSAEINQVGAMLAERFHCDVSINRKPFCRMPSVCGVVSLKTMKT